MSLFNILIFLYILLKPFYFWSSGLPQISDIILVFSFIIMLVTSDKKQTIMLLRKNVHFIIFLIFVFIINLIYFIYYTNIDFVHATLYYTFNTMGILIFTKAFEDKNKHTVKMTRTAFMLSLILQLALYFLKIGKQYSQNRYMGTFNDPNQFAFFCLLAYCYIYLLMPKNKRFSIINFTFLSLATYLIILSGSTGMLLGITIFIASFVLFAVRKIFTNPRKALRIVVLATPCIVFMCCIVALLPNSQEILYKITNLPIYSRVQEKTMKASGEADVSLWEERGYDRIMYYPHYIIYGAGQGNNSRFEKAYHHGELHATLPAVLFCYGIAPTLLLIKWILKKLRGVEKERLIVYVALIAESFTLANSRQVLFWSIFIIAPLLIEGEHNGIE